MNVAARLSCRASGGRDLESILAENKLISDMNPDRKDLFIGL